MFTRRATVLAALVAAYFVLTPGQAQAQAVFFGGGFGFGGGGIFGNPIYRSPYFNTYRPGWGGWGGFPSYGGIPPNFGGYPYGGYMTPGLYPGAYNNPGSYPSGLGTLPYTPGLNLAFLSPTTMSGPPSAGYYANDLNRFSPRIRMSLGPALPVPPDSTLLRDRLGPPAERRAPAAVEVRVPADAKVWFQDQLTKQTGAVRRFESPPLRPGVDYSYRIRASWMEGGKEVTRDQTVSVRPNGRAVVDFTSK
jgi:uncharacterized protein (TIGR03000 family)